MFKDIRTRDERFVSGQMPGIGKVIDLIRSRRRRDALIIGIVSGLCLLGILSYLSR